MRCPMPGCSWKTIPTSLLLELEELRDHVKLHEVEAISRLAVSVERLADAIRGMQHSNK